MENVIVLGGGIGNQLFQISAAIHYFPHFKIYEKNLINYKTKRKSINGLLIPKYEIYNGDFLFDFIINTKITYKFNLPFFWKQYSYFYKIRFLTGYYQDSKTYGESLLKTANIIETYNKNFININCNYYKINFQNSVAIHLRFGDYLQDDVFYKIDLSYIQSALSNFENIDILYVFCNDEIPQNILLFLTKSRYSVVFIKNLALTDVEELLLMSKFFNLIISNSTFSYWGGIIGNIHKHKKVICPDKFFNEINNNFWIENCKFAGFEFVK
jgi:hypothetical protein